MEFTQSINVIANDEIGQSSAQFDNVVDNILKLICHINAYKGNKLNFAAYDPAKLQLMKG